MSNFYRNNFVIRGEQVKRVINTNDLVAEKMQVFVDEQKQARREELLRLQLRPLRHGGLLPRRPRREEMIPTEGRRKGSGG